MDSVVRQAHVDDALLLAQMRAAMWEEMNPAQRAGEAYIDQLAAYWRRTLGAELAAGWVAENERRVVGVAMLLLHEHPGRPGNEFLMRGYVTSVYVVPDARYQGIGRRLMDTLIEWSHQRGVQRLELRSSSMGRSLYERTGFEPLEFLALRLD